MKELYEVLRQKETDVGRVRREIESLQVVAFLLYDQLSCDKKESATEKDAFAVLQQKESDVARIRHEIDSLQLVIPLLADDLPCDEVNKKKESAAQKTLNVGFGPDAIGTDGLFSSMIPVSRPKFWKALKRQK